MRPPAVMVEINWPILLAQAGTFAVAVWVLWKFFWKRLVASGQIRLRRLDGWADLSHVLAEPKTQAA